MTFSRAFVDIWTRIILPDGSEFYLGTDGADDMAMDATVFALGGMAGNDTLRSGAESSFLFGDYLDASIFYEEQSVPPPYDLSVIGNDKLYGGGGEDILVGGPGNDTLAGGRGDDYYYTIGGGSDTILEFADGGIDTVSTAKLNYVLGQFLENLEFSNIFSELRRDVRGVGNASANMITGGFGDDTLSGLAGNDTLAGSMGADLLTGGAGRDGFAFGFGAFGNGNFSTGTKADTITDFLAADDQILLDPSSFNFMIFREPGVIRASQFGLIGSALTGKEKVLYDMESGDLMTGNHVVFAHVDAGTHLTYLDVEWSYL